VPEFLGRQYLVPQSSTSTFENQRAVVRKPIIGGLSNIRSKRILDFVGALVLLVILMPLILVVAVLVKFMSHPGPILFRQKRIGVNGKPFELLKFRSMCTNAEDMLRASAVLYARYLENNHKLPAHEDPRLTGVGRFIRATSLDELPQLWNVVRGEMSLVGPRPVLGTEIDRYGAAKTMLLSARPGLTGSWQVNGRSEIGYDRRVELDLVYLSNWSLSADIWILVRTPIAVFSRRGAH